jgi:uncharacterized protein (DUF4415 family)
MTRKFSAKRPLSDLDEAEIKRRIAADPDNPEITDAQIAKRKTFSEAFPDLAASIKRSRGRPKLENAKLAVTLRLDPTTVERFQAEGDDWRSRMSDALDRFASRRSKNVSR